MQQKLAVNQAKVGLAVSNSEQQVWVGMSTSIHLPKITTTTKKPSPPKAMENRIVEEADKRPMKKSKDDNPYRSKLVDHSDSAIPFDTSTFRDAWLAGSLMRVSILPEDFDICMEMSMEN